MTKGVKTMNEVMGYIFRNLESQAKFNRKVAVFALGVTALSALQMRRIRVLEIEIKELKQKGE